MRSTHSRRRPQRRPSIYGRRQAPGCKRTRLTVQDGGRAPVRAPVCLSSPACHPDSYREVGALFELGYFLPPGGRRRRCRGGGELPVANTRLTQSKMAAHTPSRALVCRWGHVCCPCLCLNQKSRARRQQSLNPNPNPKCEELGAHSPRDGLDGRLVSPFRPKRPVLRTCTTGTPIPRSREL